MLQRVISFRPQQSPRVGQFTFLSFLFPLRSFLERLDVIVDCQYGIDDVTCAEILFRGSRDKIADFLSCSRPPVSFSSRSHSIRGFSVGTSGICIPTIQLSGGKNLTAPATVAPANATASGW